MTLPFDGPWQGPSDPGFAMLGAEKSGIIHDQLKAVDHRPEFSHTLGSRSGRRRPTVTDDNDGLCFSSGQPRTGLNRQAAKTVVRSPLELRQPAKNRPAKPRINTTRSSASDSWVPSLP